MRDLAGKTAFVTGGASGIGLALCRAFVRAGMNVMLADIETEALEAAVKSPREAKRLRSGLDPSMVAARVVAAIRTDEFYVFTHPEMCAELEVRFEAIMAAMDRA